MPHVRLDELTLVRDFLPGWGGRFLHTKNMTIMDWEIRAGTKLPLHSHPHEQLTILLAGEFELKIADQTERLRPGYVSVVPSGVEHSGVALTDCHGMDVFSPVREEYAQMQVKQQQG